MRRYESYKDSGVEWLGEVPSHWNLIPNKYIFKLRKNVVGKRSSEYDLLSLSLKGVIKRDMENPEGKFPAEFDTYQEVKEGDFIFCLFDVEETPRTVGLSSYHGMITGAYTIFETNNVDKKFIYYFYLNLDSNKRLKPLYKGLRNTISKETFFSFNTFIPPLSEQQKIAQFLDDKTAKIDQAVDWAEKQIALLKEHKQILIQNAVTRGLNPDVPLKDSGVEWIGQVPEHWDVKKLKYMGYLYSGLTGKSADDFSKEVKEGFREFVPFTTICNFSQIKENVFQYVKVMNLENQNIVKKNDLLFLMSSETLEDIAKSSVYLLDQESFLNSFCKGFRFIEKHSSIFINYLINSNNYRAYFNLVGRGFTRINIKQEFVNSVYVLLPPFSEQQKIANYLDTQTAKIDQAIALETAHIEKLKEYKSVLINDVVTGKVRV